VQRHCDTCGKSYEAKRQTSRYCTAVCRTKASRAGVAAPRQSATVVPLPSRDEGLAERTETTLRDAARLGTWQGQAALAVAKRIETARMDTGSAYAALHRELRSAMAEALKGVDAPQSAVQKHRDELAARRAKRQA
jgi:hypothetical protein